jgi:nanoRNase/pAp phosphatase (c-di-AMP/oligoRNAs hydrolase)
MTYETTVTDAQLVARLRAAKRPFVTTHFKPDGDALGSVLAGMDYPVEAGRAEAAASAAYAAQPADASSQ